MIVLDTNVVSELMRSDPSPAVIDWVDRQADSTLYLTTPTLAEIRFGIAALPEGRRRALLNTTFEDQIRPLFKDRILDFDEPSSIAYADLRATARAKGLAISNADALIAAVAKANRHIVATRDAMPFEASGVRVINPFEVS